MAKQLLACPFCRELFSQDEGDICPNCDIPLRPLAELPPSFEVREQQAIEWERTAPADRTLPWYYAARGRALMLVLSLLGLATFFAPWIVITKPEIANLSGFTLTASRGFWFGGGAVAWFISVPLIVTRRTVNQMRGVRIILTLFAATSACQVVLLYLNAPTKSVIPVAYTWGWGFYASAIVSLLAVPVAARFGGRADDLPAELGSELRPVSVARETSGDNTLH